MTFISCCACSMVTPGLSRPAIRNGATSATASPTASCIDADNAVWYGDVPNKRCVRVREGGEVLQRINLDRGCFACMLGGVGKRTLFLIATEWRGMENIPEVARARTGQVLTVEAPAPGVDCRRIQSAQRLSPACSVYADSGEQSDAG